MTKAYLVQLSGMGDHRWYLLNAEDWSYLEKVCDWDRNGEPPRPSDDLIERARGESKLDSYEEMLEYLTPNPQSGSMDNDVALSMPASKFNGEEYDDLDGSPKALAAFVAKHGLDYEEVYEGHIY